MTDRKRCNWFVIAKTCFKLYLQQCYTIRKQIVAAKMFKYCIKNIQTFNKLLYSTDNNSTLWKSFKSYPFTAALWRGHCCRKKIFVRITIIIVHWRLSSYANDCPYSLLTCNARNDRISFTTTRVPPFSDNGCLHAQHVCECTSAICFKEYGGPTVNKLFTHN